MAKLRVLVSALAASLFCSTTTFAEPVWYRGNTHVHTVNSDGDSAPDVVARWYKEHGYHFVVISDHNFRTPVEGLNEVIGAWGKFIVLGGVEVTDEVDGRPVHMNALGAKQTAWPQGGRKVPELIDNNAKAIHAAKGLAVLNHPNGVLSLALTAQEIADSKTVRIFEVCCADYRGGSGHPSTDELWDSVLSQGRLLYGVAADDAHKFQGNSRQPGTAWIMVQTSELSRNAILSALNNGDFYATTGVMLADYTVDENKLTIGLADTTEYGFKTFFVGKNGTILKKDETDNPSYVFTRDEYYVRARIERSDGALAWTQPIFTAGSP